MTAVLQNPVCINVLNAFGAAGKVVEALGDPGVTVGSFPQSDIVVHAISVDGIGCHIGNAPGQLLLLFHGGRAEMNKADHGHDEGNDHHCCGHQNDNFGPQRHQARLLPVCRQKLFLGHRGLLPSRKIESFLEGCGQDLQDGCDDQHSDGFVRKIDQHVCQKLGPELACHAGSVNAKSQRRGNARAELKAVQNPGEQRSDAAADQGKGCDNCQQPQGFAETVEAMVCKPGGSDGDQNRQRSVVGRGVIADAVEDVGEKADNDAGDISAQCSDQRTADVVQIQRQVQPRCKVGEKIIDQQPHDTENQEIFPVRLAFPG